MPRNTAMHCTTRHVPPDQPAPKDDLHYHKSDAHPGSTKRISNVSRFPYGLAGAGAMGRDRGVNAITPGEPMQVAKGVREYAQ
jgi:hypothetical protein